MGDPVEAYYTSSRLLDDILTALRDDGHEVDPLDPDALAPLEELHTFGPLATEQLADAAGVVASDRVLDLGCGIGGPARRLARTRGCHVTGIDLTEEFCEVARELNRRTELDGSIEVRQGDVTDLPFADGSFDVVWTQHVTMNVADKASLYAEARRVLVPGGRFACFDVVGGAVTPLHLPVPWADDASTDHLVPRDEVLAAIRGVGFEVVLEEDPTELAAVFLAAMADEPPTALGVHLFVPRFREKIAMLQRNVEEGRARYLTLVATA